MIRKWLMLLLSGAMAVTAQAQVPRPADVFGFEPGADYKIADNSQVMAYYTKLVKASKRVKMIEIGHSVQGKPLVLLFISSEKNLANLEQWRTISRDLSLATIAEAQARRLAAQGKAIVWIDAGMHASEKACAQMAPELAYRIATEETAEMKQIRENVITLLMPVMNPDGLDIVAHWYQQQLGTPYETTSPPWLWHPYIGHDNNRDWFMNNMPETDAVSKVLYREWYPQIVYNQHQTAPPWTRIFIPPFSNPVNPNIHPGITTAVNMVGAAMANRFAMNKMPGVISQVSFDMWWNGGMRTVPYFHNQVGILTETAHPSPTPSKFNPKNIPAAVRGNTPTDGTGINYPDVWRGGESHFRDAVEYMLTSSMAVLNLAAERREQFLFNIYKMGRDAIDSKAGPRAYIIPATQWDNGEVLQLVNVLLKGGIDVQQATAAFTAGGNSYPAGSYVIDAAQAFRPYINDLLQKQVYPDLRQYPGGPPDAPYDLAGWTLPMQLGVQVDTVSTKVNAAVVLLTAPVAAAVAPGTGRGNYGFVLSARENSSVKMVNDLLKQGVGVSRTNAGFSLNGTYYPKGSYIAATQLPAPVGAAPLDQQPSVGMTPMQAVRIGIYKSWVANMDEGWTRWIMEQYHFSIDTLHDQDILQKDLKQYKAIIIPDQGKKQLMFGYRKGSMPEQYTGGLGLQGLLALKNYTEQGGTLIAFDEACNTLIEQLDLPLKDAVEGATDQQFYIPGSLIRTVVDTAHALGWGMQKEVAASFNKSRAFTVLKAAADSEGQESSRQGEDKTVEIVASYARKDLLMSGWALNADKYIAGKAAVVRVNQGEGRIVLFAFRPQFRAQAHATYKLIFNAIYN